MFGICEVDLISGCWKMIGCTENEEIAKAIVSSPKTKFRVFYKIELFE